LSENTLFLNLRYLALHIFHVHINKNLSKIIFIAFYGVFFFILYRPIPVHFLTCPIKKEDFIFLTFYIPKPENTYIGTVVKQSFG